MLYGLEMQVKKGLADYVRYTSTKGVIADIEDSFINRLVRDSWDAKKGLRQIFRNIPSWNEEKQFAIVKGEMPYQTDYCKVRRLIVEILGSKVNDSEINYAIDFFCRANGAKYAFDALNRIAPKAYRANKPVQRIFQDFCKAVGAYDKSKGSNYQRLFAQLSNEYTCTRKKIDLILSINPIHFLTISNPVDDDRGSSLISCHSLNRTDYQYSAGNIGYARDDVTFVAFTVKDPQDAESLNSRKTSRQLYMYKNGVLLQSRLYDTNGGIYGENNRADIYRAIVQRAISEAENAPVEWQADTYKNNKWGLYCGANDCFTGYADWKEFGKEIKISVRADVERPRGFIIGESALCVVCGEDLYGDEGHYCEACDVCRVRCEECGELIDAEDAICAYDVNGNEVYICSNCAEDYYCYCECCGNTVHVEGGEWVDGGNRWVCNDCIENYYTTCDECGEIVHSDDIVCITDEHGDERFVCYSCGENYNE